MARDELSDDSDSEAAKLRKELKSKTADDYFTDSRSGDELTDDEEEFNSIIELDSLLKSFSDNILEDKELQTKIMELISKFYTLKDLIDYGAQNIKEVIEEIVAKELVFFTSYT